MKQTLDQVAEQLISARTYNPDDSWLIRKSEPAFGMTLTQRPDVAKYPTGQLNSVLLGAIGNLLTYKEDPNYTMEILKNSNRTGTYMVDQIQRQLRKYVNLSTIFIDDDNLSIRFTNPLNTEDIALLLQQELPGKVDVKDTESSKGIPMKKIFQNGFPHISIMPYQITAPYQASMAQNMLPLTLKIASELTSRIHQDSLFDMNARIVELNKYVPIMQLLAPELFNLPFGDNLVTIRDYMQDGSIKTTPEFSRTRRLDPDGKEMYRLIKQCHPGFHFEYILAAPKEEEIYIKMDSPFLQDDVERLARSHNLRFGPPTKVKKKLLSKIKKGAGSRVKVSYLTIIQSDVFNEQGEKVVSFSKNNATLYTNTSEKAYMQATKFLNDVQEQRLFYTGWIKTQSLDSKLQPIERQFIEAIDFMEQMYTFFAERHVVTERLGSGDTSNVRPLRWIYESLAESKNQSVPGRILHTLEKINSYIDTQRFRDFGTDPGRQDEVHQNYQNLLHRIGRFEAMLNKA